MKIKRIEDYYDLLHEMYPEVPMSDLKKILQFGWKSLYLHNSYGGDVIVRDQSLFVYFGRLMTNSINWFKYYKKKLATKILVLYKRRLELDAPFDGTYYFALDAKQEEEYWASIHKKGRPKKWFTFGPIILYRCKEECLVREAEKSLFFKVFIPGYIGWHAFKRKFRTDLAEILLKRDNKFKDLLVTNNNYEYI